MARTSLVILTVLISSCCKYKFKFFLKAAIFDFVILGCVSIVFVLSSDCRVLSYMKFTADFVMVHFAF